MELDELLENWLDKNKAHNFEGETGLKHLNKLAEALGYREDGFKYGSSLERFLGDNSGACQALIDWIADASVPEWKEALTCKDESDEDDDEDSVNNSDLD